MKKALILTDITSISSINGVYRCIKEIVNIFSHKKTYQVIWIRFTLQILHNYTTQKENNYYLINIPFPNNTNSYAAAIKRDEAFRKAYNVLQKICYNTAKTWIINVHTLNLMDFALYLKQESDCRIVTHLHVIPWKTLYDTNGDFFYNLYTQSLSNNYDDTKFIRSDYEFKSYTQSNTLICVTQYAKDFVCNVCKNNTSIIRVVNNGLSDSFQHSTTKNHTETRCVFVGSPNPSKGLMFLLKSLNFVQMKYKTCLYIAGNYPKDMQKRICMLYPFLELHFVGLLEEQMMLSLYQECDMGILPSLHEQCSYAAIEMMRSGLPIVSSDVDGLGEMFKDGYNALLVHPQFDKKQGLTLNPRELADAIESIIVNEKLRERLSRNARRTYLKKYTASQMAHKLEAVYEYVYSMPTKEEAEI